MLQRAARDFCDLEFCPPPMTAAADDAADVQLAVQQRRSGTN